VIVGRSALHEAWFEARIPRVLPPLWKVCEQGRNYFHVFNPSSGRLSVILSGDVEADGKRWLHASIARPDRLPSWDDIRFIKDRFVGEDLYAVQVLPPLSKHVNFHPYCLHLFACLDEWPLPDFTAKYGGGIL